MGALAEHEREEISRYLSQGLDYAVIGRLLQRAASTICREVNASGGRDHYRAGAAEARAREAARRPKQPKLAMNPGLRRLVAEKLEQDWSPEQIPAWLALTFPGREELNVSHETIYKTCSSRHAGSSARN